LSFTYAFCGMQEAANRVFDGGDKDKENCPKMVVLKPGPSGEQKFASMPTVAHAAISRTITNKEPYCDAKSILVWYLRV
jgi:hypothetical protein